MLRTSSGRLPEVARRHLVAAITAALVAGALTLPASALAGGGSTGGGSSGGGDSCTAELTRTQDVTVASFSVDCGDGNDITSVRLGTSESGSVQGGTGTDCTEEDSTTFNCAPTSGSLITGRFTNAREQEVCADPRLTVDFTIELADGSTETVENFDVTGCDDSGDASGTTSGDDAAGDEGSAPEGGVDSGRGPVESASSSALPLAGAILAVLSLAGGTLLVRRRRTTG
ncbi:MAG: hypothetical protein H0T96_06880 [Thermoleophilaceae bacterium]|nr:hypothetical protein [Thermoleophilaceae bacterium]